MSYREENGQVVVTMSFEDYERVMQTLRNFRHQRKYLCPLLDRLNEGNPKWQPYQVEQPR